MEKDSNYTLDSARGFLQRESYVCAQLLSCVFVTPWTVGHQGPLSMGFPRQEYWSGLPFPSPGESSWLRGQTQVSCITVRFFTVWATRQALNNQLLSNFCFQSTALTDEATVGICVDSSFGNCVNKYVGQNFRVKMTILVIFVTDHLEQPIAEHSY